MDREGGRNTCPQSSLHKAWVNDDRPGTLRVDQHLRADVEIAHGGWQATDNVSICDNAEAVRKVAIIQLSKLPIPNLRRAEVIHRHFVVLETFGLSKSGRSPGRETMTENERGQEEGKEGREGCQPNLSMPHIAIDPIQRVDREVKSCKSCQSATERVSSEEDESGVFCQGLSELDVNELSHGTVRVPKPAVHECLECGVDSWSVCDSSSEELGGGIEHCIRCPNDSTACRTNNLPIEGVSEGESGRGGR
jgi:hypothetical protein